MTSRRAVVTVTRGVRDVPAPVLGLASVPRVDYVDHVVLATEVEASPERWARSMFGDTADAAQRVIWRGLLGLRIAAGRSATTVAGWRIAAGGDDWIRLAADSPSLAANLVVRTTPGPRREVSLTTVVHYVRRPARVWPVLSVVHRALVPGVLRDAERQVLRRRPGRGSDPRA